MKNQVRQFKLSNNEEIVCEVVEWPTEEEPSMVIKRPMKVITMENYKEGSRYFAFRPWLIFQEEKNLIETSSIQILNTMHIVVECSPSDYLKRQYYRFINEMESMDSKKPLTGDAKIDKKALQELQKDLKELELLVKDEDIEIGLDSNSPGNVIKFKPKGTIH
tara:strand:+ start:114 stop:602 length:489 start_codon:yes stop_codon:yes gene_type:complete